MIRTSLVSIAVILVAAACMHETKPVREPGITETVTKHPELRGK